MPSLHAASGPLNLWRPGGIGDSDHHFVRTCGRDLTLHTAASTPPIDLAVDAVVAAAQRGDAAAFATLYDAHAPRVYALVLGMSGDEVAAAELVQDTFVRAWEALSTFRGDCAFTTWLHRIAVNITLTQARSSRRRTLRVAIESDLAAADDGIVPAEGEAPVRDVALHMDLASAIRRLPAGARTVFVLHDVGGYGHSEIGQQLGIAEGTSKAHLFRARRLLRGMLDR